MNDKKSIEEECDEILNLYIDSKLIIAQLSFEKPELYPDSLISVYNCNNCEYFDECDVERIDFNGDYRLYKCFGHSHFEEDCSRGD